MKNLNNYAKIVCASTVSLSILACDGQVEFTEIPQAISLCQGTSCLSDQPTDPTDTVKEEQGYILKTRSDFVIQEGTGGEVDILIVVDNSYSMYEEQKKMGERFGDFISTLNDVDWRLAFTTTDARTSYSRDRFGGNLLNLVGAKGKVLTKNTPDLINVFRQTIDRRKDQQDCGFEIYDIPCASGTEEPLKAITLAVTKSSSEHKAFFRQSAALAVIVLSDEDEMSFGPRDATSPQTVVNVVKSAFGPNKKFLVSGIIIQPNDSICLAEQQPDGVVGNFVFNLSALTGGITRSLCDTDYKPSMKAISEKVRKVLKIEEIDLEFPPAENTVQLRFLPAENIVNWRVEKQKVIFSTPPKDGTRIEYSYKYKFLLDGDDSDDEEDDED